jgi:hypothetical protein
MTGNDDADKMVKQGSETPLSWPEPAYSIPDQTARSVLRE